MSEQMNKLIDILEQAAKEPEDGKSKLCLAIDMYSTTTEMLGYPSEGSEARAILDEVYNSCARLCRVYNAGLEEQKDIKKRIDNLLGNHDT